MPHPIAEYWRSLRGIVTKRVFWPLRRRFHLSRRRVVFAVQFLAACLLAFSAEKALEHQFESGAIADNPLTKPVIAVDAVYHRIAASGPRKPRPHYTTLIEIDPRKDPGVPTRDTICDQRAFLGILLTKLASAQVTPWLSTSTSRSMSAVPRTRELRHFGTAHRRLVMPESPW